MGRIPAESSSVYVVCAAIFVMLTLIGCVSTWYDDGPLGIASVLVLAALGLVSTVAAHRSSGNGG